jgi:N-dimethylarginine dimethylaminohydrolase
MTETDGTGRRRAARARTYLMCPPEYFTVEYAINPWMNPDVPQLAEKGFEPVPVDMSEFRKAGGGPKCCTLELR